MNWPYVKYQIKIPNKNQIIFVRSEHIKASCFQAKKHAIEWFKLKVCSSYTVLLVFDKINIVLGVARTMVSSSYENSRILDVLNVCYQTV